MQRLSMNCATGAMNEEGEAAHRRESVDKAERTAADRRETATVLAVLYSGAF